MTEITPVDVFRRPFIEPLGHLALQGAFAEQSMTTLVALTLREHPEEPLPIGKADAKLRKWNNEAREYVKKQIESIADPDLRAQASKALQAYSELRERRNRAIHDAVEVGLDETGRVDTLAIQHSKHGETVREITPYTIGALARELYEFAQDLKFLIGNIESTSC